MRSKPYRFPNNRFEKPLTSTHFRQRYQRQAKQLALRQENAPLFTTPEDDALLQLETETTKEVDPQLNITEENEDSTYRNTYKYRTTQVIDAVNRIITFANDNNQNFEDIAHIIEHAIDVSIELAQVTTSDRKQQSLNQVAVILEDLLDPQLTYAEKYRALYDAKTILHKADPMNARHIAELREPIEVFDVDESLLPANYPGKPPWKAAHYAIRKYTMKNN